MYNNRTSVNIIKLDAKVSIVDRSEHLIAFVH